MSSLTGVLEGNLVLAVRRQRRVVRMPWGRTRGNLTRMLRRNQKLAVRWQRRLGRQTPPSTRTLVTSSHGIAALRI